MFPKYKGVCNGCENWSDELGIYVFTVKTYYFCMECFFEYAQPLNEDYIPKNTIVPRMTHCLNGYYIE
jgi:hypothetical protein